MENNINFSAWGSQSEYTGLLIFRSVVKPRNPAKFGRNLIKYMSVQHIWNLFQLLGLFTCRKLGNLSWTFVTESCKKRPETTRPRLCCEKLGTSYESNHKIGRFFRKFVPKNPSKFDFFFRDLSEALEYRLNQNSVDVVVQRFLCFDNFQNRLKFVTIWIS